MFAALFAIPRVWLGRRSDASLTPPLQQPAVRAEWSINMKIPFLAPFIAALGLVALASPALHPGAEQKHESFNVISKQGEAPLVFLGDSITAGWKGRGKEVWAKHWAPLKAANFGIGGDRTEHILWRLQNGNYDGLKPET